MKRIEHPASGGSIRTLLGRKCRFPLWEPTEWGVNKALPREQAVIEYGVRIKRAGTYKGLNRLIQGSAADQTKAGMVALHKAGFNLILQVHDEVALSVRNKEEAREAANLDELEGVTEDGGGAAMEAEGPAEELDAAPAASDVGCTLLYWIER
jgi:DNA polymerase I-like protein with 3'-5' exonuclease and polymerase domains